MNQCQKEPLAVSEDQSANVLTVKQKLPNRGQGQHQWALLFAMLGLRSFFVWVFASFLLALLGVSLGFLFSGGYIVFLAGALLVCIGSFVDGFQTMAHKSSTIAKDTSADDVDENHGSVGW
jgi:lipopolysaccharide export LptBFGC system permease protein LptF